MKAATSAVESAIARQGRPLDYIPFLARFTPKEFGRFRVADDLFCSRIPAEFATNAKCDVAEMSDGAGPVAHIHIGNRFAARSYALDEVFDMQIGAVCARRLAAFGTLTLYLLVTPLGSRAGGRLQFRNNFVDETIAEKGAISSV